MAEKQKFPTEIIDLPSGGKIYGKDSPLHDGKIEIKYMTAKEEDILTSQNLITKGIVIEKLMDSLIITEGVTSDDLTDLNLHSIPDLPSALKVSIKDTQVSTFISP